MATSPRRPPTTCSSRGGRCSAAWSAWPRPTSPSSSRRRPHWWRCSPAGGSRRVPGWPACRGSTHPTWRSSARTGCARCRCRSTGSAGRPRGPRAAAGRRPAAVRAPHPHREPSRAGAARAPRPRRSAAPRACRSCSTRRSHSGHTDTDLGADVVYSTSRKWLTGPRGVGILCVHPALAAAAHPGAARAAGRAAAPGLRVRRGARGRPGRAGRGGREHLAADRTGCASGWRRSAAPPGNCSTAWGWRAGRAGRRAVGNDHAGAPGRRRRRRHAGAAARRRHRHHRHRAGARARGAHRAPLRVSPHIDGTVDDLRALAAAL